MRIRPLEHTDLADLIKMLGEYMAETYASEWHGSIESLSKDAFGTSIHFLVAELDGRLGAFIAWTDSYDLHWSMRGAVIADLFVRPNFRGHALALQLICGAAAQIEAKGGTFLKGGAVESGSVQRLYARAAVASQGVDYTLSGRAFRHMSALAGASARVLVKSIPEKQWNLEE